MFMYVFECLLVTFQHIVFLAFLPFRKIFKGPMPNDWKKQMKRNVISLETKIRI